MNGSETPAPVDISYKRSRKRYPFIVRTSQRQFAKHVYADNYKHALDKILSLYPSKFIITTYSNMDLIDAKVQAAKESKAQKGKNVYVYNDVKAEEVEISLRAPVAPNELITIFVNGSEVKDLPTPEPTTAKASTKAKAKEQKEVESKIINSPKTNEVMAKTAKKSAPKKAAKKAAKKSAPKAAKVEKLIRGNNMALTEAQWGKVDRMLDKEGVSWSSWMRKKVLKAIGEAE